MSLSRGNWTRLLLQFCLILSLAFLLLVSPAAAGSVLADEGTTHIVHPGENLSSIAARYGVNVYALARYNGIGNVNLLRVGQVLQIPGTTIAPAPAQKVYPTPTRAYEAPVTPGAVTTPTPYIVLYPTPTPTRLVPTPIPPATTIRVHVVAAFETLTGIANLYGTTSWAIKSRNGLTSDTVNRGQRLIIP